MYGCIPHACYNWPHLANNNLTLPGRVISAVSMEEFLHMEDFRVAKEPVRHECLCIGYTRESP